MDTINGHQVIVMQKLVRGRIHTALEVSATSADINPDQVNQGFNDILRLVQLGLLADLSNWPQFSQMAKTEASETGAEVVVVRPTRLGEIMFTKVKWDKWKN